MIFDDDHYFSGEFLAEKLRGDGLDVTLVTPATDVSNGTQNTLEQPHIHRHLMTMGVEIKIKYALSASKGSKAVIRCT